MGSTVSGGVVRAGGPCRRVVLSLPFRAEFVERLSAGIQLWILLRHFRCLPRLGPRRHRSGGEAHDLFERCYDTQRRDADRRRTLVSLPSGSTLGRYRILEQIGRGGMASVFRAHDPELNRTVAIKVLPSYHSEDANFVQRFRHEAQAVASLNHPNIVQVHDFGDDKGFSFIVMEHLTGGTLHDRMNRRLTLPESIDLLGPIAEALQHAHEQGIVHRDIKPNNVLIDDSGRPKLSDFGLARMLEGSAGLTGPDSLLGTPEYMAPEQALGRPADQKSDLYAFGVLIYQMLLGQTPFHEDTPPETLLAHVHQPVPLPSAVETDIDPRLEANLIQALAKDPDDRHESPTELVDALRAVAIGAEIGTSIDFAPTAAEIPTPRVDRQTYRRRLARRQVLAPVLVLVGLGLVGTAIAVWVVRNDSAAEIVAPPVAVALATSTQATQELSTTPAPGLPSTKTQALESTSPIPASPSPTAGATATVGSPTATATASPAPSPSAVPVRTPAAVADPSPMPATSRTYEPVTGELLAQLKDVFQKMSEVRGLEALEEVEPKLASRQEMEDLIVADGISKRETLLKTQQALFELLQLVPNDFDLSMSLREVDREFFSAVPELFAYYHEESKEFYVLQDLKTITPLSELEVASQYVLALLDQHFDVFARQTQAEENLDFFHTFDAFIYGDSAQALGEYLFAHVSLEELRAVAPEGTTIETPTMDDMPGAVVDWMFFSEQGGLGQMFVSFLQSDGWSAVDRAYLTPPGSTEQLIHPNKYKTGEGPVAVDLPNLAAALGPGWTETHSSVMGEEILSYYLESLADRGIFKASDGWGGDRFSILQGPLGERALAALFSWDTSEDAQEFYDFVESNTEAAGQTWVGIDDDQTLLVVGPHTALITRITAEFPGF